MAESVSSLVERLDECVNDSEATAMNAVYVNVLLRDVLAYLKREAASRLSEQCIQTSDNFSRLSSPERIVFAG